MKAVIIGAGSAFGGRLSVDILSRTPLQNSTIALVDIDEDKLDKTAAYVENVIATNKLPAKLEKSTDRKTVLSGADVVVLSVSIGGPAYFGQPYESEIDIPMRYGIVQAVGDTMGPGGLFRALRSAHVMREMIEDINRLAPDAVILNYTNPMAILTWLFSEWSSSPVIGLCHGVTGNSKAMAKLIDVPYDECTFTAAGINHMTWFLDFKHKGKDVLEDIHKKIIEVKNNTPRQLGNPKPQSYVFRGEMLEYLHYFTTESDRHFPEYVPYYQHEDRFDFMDYYKITKGVKGKRQKWYEDMGIKAEKAESVELIRSHESMSGIMEAMCTGEAYTFSGNVLNSESYISNLPQKSVVELPVKVAGKDIQATRIGDIPFQCAAMSRTNIIFQEMTVRAIQAKSREAAFHALMFDPQTQAVLAVKRIKQMFDEMWEAEKDLLETYS